jgi:Fe(3+) dicitrate transport protein
MVDAGPDSSGALERSTTPTRVTAKNQGQAHALALHAVDTLEFHDLTMTPGLRMEVVWTDYQDFLDASLDNKQTQVGLLPGMGVHYALTETIGVLAGGYRGFGPAAPQPLIAGEDANPAETSTTWEAGARYATERTHAEAVGYLMEYGNLTADCSQSRGCTAEQVGTQFNGDKARVWGLEGTLAHEFHAGTFQIPTRATYALTMSAFRTEFTSTNPEWGAVEIGDELPYLPRHQGTLGTGIGQEGKWTIDATGTFVSSSRETAGFGPIDDSDRTDAYALLGLAGRVKIYGQLWLYSRATNLLDQVYLVSRRPHGARPGAPRWVQVGITLEH